MTGVQSALDAQEIVIAYYNKKPLGPQPHSFKTHKQGFTWIVEFTLGGPISPQKSRWHINAKNGAVIRKE